MSLPQDMNAVTIDRFGGLDVLTPGRRPVPQADAGQVLIKIAYAGVGTWDPIEREGGFVEFTGETPDFPHTLGSDGSGTIAAIGSGVDGFSVGDQVYALGGGFYADYVAVDAGLVAKLPAGLALDQAGALPITGLTALHGLVDALDVKAGETVLINGASGDVGHIAVQLAKRLGARVLAVASGEDGVNAVRGFGADVAIDGRSTDVAAAARQFAPDGLDAVLALVGGAAIDAVIPAVRSGGRVAYPLGVEPEPQPRAGVDIQRFDLTLDTPEVTSAKTGRLNALIESGPFRVALSTIFPLDQAVAAQQALRTHRVGKILLATAAS